jgi:hypothetical protein
LTTAGGEWTKRKEAGHYSGLFSNNTLNSALNCCVQLKTVCNISYPPACHQLWLQQIKVASGRFERGAKFRLEALAGGHHQPKNAKQSARVGKRSGGLCADCNPVWQPDSMTGFSGFV